MIPRNHSSVQCYVMSNLPQSYVFVSLVYDCLFSCYGSNGGCECERMEGNTIFLWLYRLK